MSSKFTNTIAFLFITFLTLNSCGLFKSYNDLSRKGYDVSKDTIIIKPYEYFIKEKGYGPLYEELNPVNKLDLRISIKGFEDADTIQLQTILNDFHILLNDTSASIISGELRFRRFGGVSHVKKLENFLTDSCRCRLSFGYLKDNQKSLRKGDFLFFWNVHVLKNGISYTIPSRKYILK